MDVLLHDLVASGTVTIDEVIIINFRAVKGFGFLIEVIDCSDVKLANLIIRRIHLHSSNKGSKSNTLYPSAFKAIEETKVI